MKIVFLMFIVLFKSLDASLDVVYDAKCPYGNQASLNNAKAQNSNLL